MHLAMQGDRAAACAFFSAFLKGPLFVPRRFQAQPLSDSPKYPDQFLDILAVQDKERVLVPVFSEAQYISDWSGTAFEYRTFSGADLLKLMPEQWWIVLNPALEIDKEFSPWEISELKHGADGIEAVLDELLEEDSIAPLSVEQTAEQDFLKLKGILREKAASLPEVSRVLLLKDARQAEASEPPACPQLLVVVRTDVSENDRLAAVREDFKTAIDVCQIGAEPCRLFVAGKGDKSPLAALFSAADPVYSRPEKQFSACSLLPGWLRSALHWRSR